LSVKGALYYAANDFLLPDPNAIFFNKTLIRNYELDIPIGIAVHIPLRLIGEFSLGIVLAGLGGAVLYCGISGWFFYRGLRRYESGNMIAGKQ